MNPCCHCAPAAPPSGIWVTLIDYAIYPMVALLVLMVGYYSFWPRVTEPEPCEDS